jgi:hypothetical protein
MSQIVLHFNATQNNKYGTNDLYRKRFWDSLLCHMNETFPGKWMSDHPTIHRIIIIKTGVGL